MSEIKYVLCPDYIASKHDNDYHWITARMLINLYGVNPSECIERPSPSSPERRGWIQPEGTILLYPDSHGEYKLPEPPE